MMFTDFSSGTGDTRPMRRVDSVVDDDQSVELVRLAMAVEAAVPGDRDRALACLRLMSLELRVDDERDAVTTSSPSTSTRACQREKLARVVAQLECSLATGHVLAVGGLLRQVRQYLA
jgi:hypothetical protein